MKFIAYEVRDDEVSFFNEATKKNNMEVIYTHDKLNLHTVSLSKDCIGVTILGCNVDTKILDKLKELGVKYLATRTIGYDHIDIHYANKIGIKVSNAKYGPNGVADFTVMLMLMSIRKYKQALFRGNVNDYSLSGLQGKEMKSLTIGVIGTGRIGQTVIENLQGFGSKIIAYDAYENQNLQGKVTYVDLATIYKKSDVITLHTPLFQSTYHLINKQTLEQMKDGVVLINTARGELMDLVALVEGLESKKIGALGVDVIENEQGIYHLDRRFDIIRNRDMAYIRQFPNVTMTQHIAFYTEEAVESMVQCAVESLNEFAARGQSENEIFCKL